MWLVEYNGVARGLLAPRVRLCKLPVVSKVQNLLNKLRTGMEWEHQPWL